MDRLYIETKIMAGDDGVVTAMAWPFGTPDRVGDWIDPGAFKGVRLPIPMLFGHDMNDPIGTWDVATEKTDGLHIAGKALINDVSRAREVMALVKSGTSKASPSASSQRRRLPGQAAAGQSNLSNFWKCPS